MRAFVGVTCLVLSLGPACAAAGVQTAFWLDGNECVHVDTDPPEDTEVNIENCTYWVGTSGGECVYVNTEEPWNSAVNRQNCPAWAGTTNGECVYIDLNHPWNSRVNVDKCLLP